LPKSPLIRIAFILASLKLTLIALALLVGAVLYVYWSPFPATLAMLPPLGLLALNLVAAIATKPVFRRQTALLIFHLSLLVVVLLVVAGRLTYLKGTVELVEGEDFSGTLSAFEAGPWHPFHLDRLHFTNHGFSIAYAPGQMREKTRNLVSFPDDKGNEQQTEIGDTTPLVLQGYRFYTTPNKGFAPTFYWRPDGEGEPMLGAVHLPSYPVNEYRQAREWTLPGSGIKLWTYLAFDEAIIDPAKPSEFRLPTQHQLIVRIADSRHELQPGQSISLFGGKLVYLGLRSWMGYTVFYDWTIHWLLAACAVAVLALGWHFWQKFETRSWNS
jgi:cytochrome c biogenesis protein